MKCIEIEACLYPPKVDPQWRGKFREHLREKTTHFRACDIQDGEVFLQKVTLVVQDWERFTIWYFNDWMQVSGFQVGEVVVPTVGPYAKQPCKIIKIEANSGSRSGWFTCRPVRNSDNLSDFLFTGDEITKIEKK